MDCAPFCIPRCTIMGGRPHDARMRSRHATLALGWLCALGFLTELSLPTGNVGCRSES